MTSGPVDIEAIVVAALLDAAGTSALVGTRVGTELPPAFEDNLPRVNVLRIGGSFADPELGRIDAGRVQVDAWAATKVDAFRLAQQIAEDLVALDQFASEYGTITGVRLDQSPVWSPDPEVGVARYFLTATVYAHRGTSVPTPTVADTFTRADSALTLGDAETGGTWTYTDEAFGIAGGAAYVPGGAAGNAFALLDIGRRSRCYVEVDITHADNGLAGLAISSDPTDLLNGTAYVYLAPAALIGIDLVGVLAIPGNIAAYRIFTDPLVIGDTYNLRAEVDAGLLTVLLDGEHYLTIPFAADTAGTYAGLFANGAGAASARWDNFHAGPL